MTYIKKLVIQGFKSFPRKTELPFTPGINVVLGPNGSGKSNISDALCFVLGRLSIKSMRAAKAGNLIFLGTKTAAPAKEATVEIIFDNSNREFSLEESEISIKRTVRRNGQSIYKINDQTKTRQDVLSLLAQTGIDPNGFNIILQGEIQNFVRMHGEERRKVLEEVSGISIYESRKEKSLSELEKTEEKLKEVLAILRERTAYLANLEKERQQALRFKKLQNDEKVFRASIISHDLTKKKKEKADIEEDIAKRAKEIEKIRKERISIETSIEILRSKISSINSTIQKSTGLEQERLNQEIANLRAELAGMNVRFENFESRAANIQKQKDELNKVIKTNDLSISELKYQAPSTVKNKKELDAKKQELEKLEEERKKFYTNKTELKSLKERIQDKKSILQSQVNESEFLLKQIKSLSLELFDIKTDEAKLSHLKQSIAEKKALLEDLNHQERELEKLSYSNENEIEKQTKIIDTIAGMEICPLCKSKITKEHINSISKETLPRIEALRNQIDHADKKLSEIYNRREILKQDIEQITSEIAKRESDMMRLSNINDKKDQIKTFQEKINKSNAELEELEKRRKILEKGFDENSNIEQKCETLRIELQEISLRTEETLDSEISFKQRELERSKISLKQLMREEEDLNEDIKSIKKEVNQREELLQQKKEQEEKLSRQFEKFIAERDALQSKIRDSEIEIQSKQNSISNVERGINDLKIEKARVDAELENLEADMLSYPEIEIIKASRESLINRLQNTQDTLAKIGSVNLRSLEVYDSIKQEYDTIKDKVDIIAKEKESILRIIHEIDVKKKKAFLRTLESLNGIFSRNFSQLSTKGEVTLDLEDKKDPFAAGVNITVKTGHGKYFDVKSLSGGEQTLVALSLIFGIQELNPYYFYILDEIDAALDKRNSARLAELLKRYMQKGQYIVITHNDEVISNATNIYGVSMHEGISKVVSMKI
ncbi:MAG: chromosome segregation SMC family protein [Parcubacteria group bacterium]|jgi:chromosome segregation protein